MGSFALASLAAMPIVAELSDRAGRRAPILAGLIVCGLSCAAMVLPASLPGFLAARVGAGFGWAGILVGGTIVTAEVAPPGRLAQALGVSGILTLAAMAIGPSLGEVIVRRVSFDGLFLTAAALCGIGAIGALFLPTGTRTVHSGGKGLTFAPSLRRPL